MTDALRRSALLAICACLLAACGRFETEVGRPLDLSQHDFQVGETGLSTVTRALGPPTQLSALPDGIAYLYEYTDAVEWQLGLGLNILDIQELRLIKAVAGLGSLDHQVFVLTFDRAGTLSAIGSGRRDSDLGTGYSLQWIVDAVPVVDTSNYETVGAQNTWGRALLEPPPTTLNTQQDLESGAAGFQLRGTPEGIGQHSLEHGR